MVYKFGGGPRNEARVPKFRAPSLSPRVFPELRQARLAHRGEAQRIHTLPPVSRQALPVRRASTPARPRPSRVGVLLLAGCGEPNARQNPKGVVLLRWKLAETAWPKMSDVDDDYFSDYKSCATPVVICSLRSRQAN